MYFREMLMFYVFLGRFVDYPPRSKAANPPPRLLMSAHLNTATFQNLQTLANFSDFVLWLIVRCWLLTSFWLLGVAGCSKLQCL